MKQSISIFACQNLLEYINCKFCPRKEGVYSMYQFVQYGMIELHTSQFKLWYSLSQVHRSQGGELETTVEISGEPEARGKAREMIEEIVTPIKDITEKLSGTV